MPKEIKKILVVDDTDYFATAMASCLARKGYQATCAKNGKKAFEMLQVDRFDAVVTDIRMPEMNGIELLQAIKATRPLPVVVVTGFSELVEIVTPTDLGADGYLTKPFKSDDLLSLLDSLLSTPSASVDTPEALA